ncbi:MAG: hypothetical protein PHW60_04145 [Kiritimatiellae bacterium]|nr:hypothetical protein [Kiritimatiellia bacterium]
MAWMILLIGLIASAVMAAYYRYQANDFRKQMAAVEKQARPARESLQATLKQAAPVPAAPASKQSGSGADEQALAEREARIRELEAALQNKDTLIVSLQQAATNRAADTSRPPRRRQSWLDELKKNNPQQYAAFTNQREQVRQAAQMSVAEQATYFRDRDLSNLSEEGLAAYQRMSQLLDETCRLTELMHSANLSESDRRIVAQTLHQDRHELGPLLESARSQEFVNLGLQLGYNNDDAQALGEYIRKVIDLTSPQPIYRNMQRGARQTAPPSPP